jgi:hypothetical protein
MKRVPALPPERRVAPSISFRVVPLASVALNDKTAVGKGEVRSVGPDPILGDRREAQLPHRLVEQGFDRRHGRESVGGRSQPEPSGDVAEALERPVVANWVDEILGVELVEISVRGDEELQSAAIRWFDDISVQVSEISRRSERDTDNGEGLGRLE